MGEKLKSSKVQKHDPERKSFIMRNKLFAIPVAVLACVIYATFAPSKSPIVQTTLGQLQGTVGRSREGKPVYEFVGIPYSAPPLLDLRFEVWQ